MAKSKSPRSKTASAKPSLADRFSRMFAPPELYDPQKRKAWKLEEGKTGRGPYVIELNLQHIEGLNGAANQLKALHARLMPTAPPPVQIARTYYRCDMTVEEWKTLLATDGQQAEDAAKAQAKTASGAGQADPMQYRAIYKLWPDFPLESQIYKSMPTIKADAALRSFDAAGDGIVWAVLDSGIDRGHPHFTTGGVSMLESPAVRDLHRSFIKLPMDVVGFEGDPQPLPDPDDEQIDQEERRRRIDRHRDAALTDEFGHGTHVAGIIAGSAPLAPAGSNVATVCAFERVHRADETGELVQNQYEAAEHRDAIRFRGVAPKCKLISLRVLDAEGGGRSSDIIQALAYIRERLNDNPKLLRVHGVNLSVGYEFDAEMFACGQSPVCAEVNRLVQSGVVVVAAAGNTGYGTVGAQVRATKVGLSNTINDPGNADMAITVGATHRDSPHTFGVSYFSSKGPTGDGRLKPDLVAPGERIASCAAGRRLEQALRSVGKPRDPEVAYYMEDSGTSMAAPHVSGAVAAFLSIRREFIGKPHEVKKVFTSTATPLGRERYFEGHGLVDLIRAIQSV
jgi:subtilisin family serine protease